jgi:DNA-binding transcriptional LysR family regulator
MDKPVAPARLRLKVEDLQLVALLGETATLSRAAEQLHVTPAALSKRLAAVEESMGVQLFERTPTGMHKTAYGAALARRARVIIDELHKAEAEIGDLLEDRRLRLNVGAFFVAFPQLLPQALARLVQASPRALVSVQEGDMQHLGEGLRQRELDMIVGRICADPTGELKVEPLYDEKLFAVARPGHALCFEHDLSWSKVAAYPWVLPAKNSPVRTQLQQGFLESRTAGPQVIVEMLSVPATLGMLESSEAIALLPQSIAAAEQARGRIAILRLALPPLPAPMAVAWRSDRPLSPLGELMLNSLRACAQELRNASAVAAPARVPRT